MNIIKTMLKHDYYNHMPTQFKSQVSKPYTYLLKIIIKTSNIPQLKLKYPEHEEWKSGEIVFYQLVRAHFPPLTSNVKQSKIRQNTLSHVIQE